MELDQDEVSRTGLHRLRNRIAEQADDSARLGLVEAVVRDVLPPAQVAKLAARLAPAKKAPAKKRTPAKKAPASKSR